MPGSRPLFNIHGHLARRRRRPEETGQEDVREERLGNTVVVVKGKNPYGRLTIFDIILAAIRNDGFESIAIIGPKGAGKSTAGLNILYAVLSVLGYRDPWQQTLKHTIFKISEYQKLVEDYQKTGQRVPLVLWDDAALHADKFRFRETYVQHFLAYFNAVREDCAAILFTMPDAQNVVKGLRDDFDHELFVPKVFVETGDGFDYGRGVALFYTWEKRIDYRRAFQTYRPPILLHTLRYDPVPEWVKEQYRARKKQAMEDVLAKQNQVLAKAVPKDALTQNELMVLSVLYKTGADMAAWEISRALEAQGKPMPQQMVARYLRNLRVLELVVPASPDGRTYRLSRTGKAFVERRIEQEVVKQVISS